MMHHYYILAMYCAFWHRWFFLCIYACLFVILEISIHANTGALGVTLKYILIYNHRSSFAMTYTTCIFTFIRVCVYYIYHEQLM